MAGWLLVMGSPCRVDDQLYPYTRPCSLARAFSSPIRVIRLANLVIDGILDV
jgi:hypothetical protein